MRTIILTGFMGTGKTSVGMELADRLNVDFVDLDKLIEDEEGMTVDEIFAGQGEAEFRRLEAVAVSRIPAENAVVATGGGAVIDPQNRRRMHEAGTVINLTAPAAVIAGRLHHDDTRPLLKNDRSIEKIETMTACREPYYADADLRVSTEGKSVADICTEIMLWLQRSKLKHS